MTKEEAARKSTLGVAVRTKDDGGLMFWETGENPNAGFWTQMAGGRVKKFGGGSRVARLDDWEPLYEDSWEHDVWVKKKGEPCPPLWSVAVGQSPVALAYRVDHEGVTMVRDVRGKTCANTP